MKNREDPLAGVLVTDFTQSEDGSVEVTVEYTDEFIDRYKSITGKKRAHKNSVAEFLRKSVEENLQNAKEKI